MSNVGKLVGRRVKVHANAFVDVPLQAWIRSVHPETNSLLLEFDSDCESSGRRFRHAVASSRLQRDSLDSLFDSGMLGSAITWIPDSEFDPASPFNLSWWRGGAAAIADVILE